jgi:acyl dehydratase
MLQISQDIIDAYAEYTGDRNGLHVNDAYARHYLNGRRVCHGTLLASLALSDLPELCAGAIIQELRVHFEGPVCIGDAIVAKVIHDAGNIHIDLQNQHGARCLKLNLKIGEPAKQPVEAARDGEDQRGMRLVHPIKKTFTDWSLDVGRPSALDYAEAEFGIPEIAALQSAQPGLMRLLARLTYAVGMVSPGAQSLLSGFRLIRCPKYDPRFTFELVSARENLSLCTYRGRYLDFEFTYSSFVRADHETYALDRSIAPSSGAYSDVRAVVIGGSGGLGARVAEQIVRSGGAALVTGRELANETGASLAFARLDVSDGISVADFAARVDEFAPTHLFYMASPRIFEKGNPGFSFPRLERFLDVYAMGLIRLLSASKRLAEVPVFWPSTMLLDAQPGGNAEYLISKAVGERMLEMLTNQPAMRVFRPRLEGFSTGQTSSLVRKAQADELPRLKSIIEEFLRS